VTETAGLQTMDATQTTQTTEHAKLGDRIVAVRETKSAQVQASATKPWSRATSKRDTAMQVEELDRELGDQIDGVLCRLHRDERVQGFNVNLVTQPR
jgi:hypothetical protein